MAINSGSTFEVVNRATDGAKWPRMLMLPDQIQIRNLLSGEMCDARIVKLTRDLAQTHIDGIWWNIGGSKQVRTAEGDHHWKWAKTVGEFRDDRFVEVVAVQSSSGFLEAAICYRLNGRSLSDPNQSAVYIERLATAPRNRPWLVEQPNFRGASDALLFRAVCHSKQRGLHGRVTLTSLPSERTRSFYEKRSFARISNFDDGTIGYELDPLKAEQWLRSRGYFDESSI